MPMPGRKAIFLSLFPSFPPLSLSLRDLVRLLSNFSEVECGKSRQSDIILLVFLWDIGQQLTRDEWKYE